MYCGLIVLFSQVSVVINELTLSEVCLFCSVHTCLIVESCYTCSLGQKVLADGAYFLALTSAYPFSG